MFTKLARAVAAIAGLIVLTTSFALAETKATPAPKGAVVAQTNPAPTPTPNPLAIRGYYRGYYFTRQNASNNPGVQYNFTPGAKYNSNGVNQATFNNGIQLHADYTFEQSGFYLGGGYFYANPMSGPCVVAANHTTPGAETSHVQSCNHQVPPNTNQDDTLPGFMLSALDEAYLGYSKYGWAAKIGDQLINTPWANPDLSRLKADAFQGADVSYNFSSGFNVDMMDMVAFQGRDNSNFSQTTLLTSYPAGGGGVGSNIYTPGGHGINTTGFFMGKVGYNSPSSQPNAWTANGYLYSVSDILNMYWGDARYNWNSVQMKPYVALQGGWESNAGNSVIGKIDSQLIGIQAGFTPYTGKLGNFLVVAGFDNLPWHNDTIYLPKNVVCNNTNYQIKATGATLAYFLPNQAAQCFTNPNGQTQIYYGGWASPYTDNWATDPIFTTQMTQGMADRRAPGTSWKIAGTFTSANRRIVFLASDAWYNYGNTLAGENSNEWDLDGQYRFSKPPAAGALYKGLLLRYRYGQRFLSNTYFPTGSAYLGGLPLFKYNRAQVEYDF